MTIQQLTYGGVAVPYTASWSDEKRFFLGRCPYSGRQAIMQDENRGAGKPLFGKPHANRQRETIARGLCDLCGRPLANRTKVSLSHARPVPHSADGFEVLQVEPMLHRNCAATSIHLCPSLKRDAVDGTLMVRHVTRFRAQFAVMTGEYVETLTGERVKAVGHAKVQLIAWIDRDADWLGAPI